MKTDELKKMLKGIGYKEELKYNENGFKSYLYSMGYDDEIIILDVWNDDGEEHAELGIVTDYISIHVDVENIKYLFDMLHR